MIFILLPQLTDLTACGITRLLASLRLLVYLSSCSSVCFLGCWRQFPAFGSFCLLCFPLFPLFVGPSVCFRFYLSVSCVCWFLLPPFVVNLVRFFIFYCTLAFSTNTVVFQGILFCILNNYRSLSLSCTGQHEHAKPSGDCCDW